jgi:hypothetical protein
MNDERKYLGKVRKVGLHEKVYEKPDGLEIDSSRAFELTRRRVLFDEVLMITFHRSYSGVFMAVNGIAALFFIGVGMMIASVSGETGATVMGAIFVVFGLPFLGGFLYSLRGKDIVTVCGRRSKGVIAFTARSPRAREVYGHLCATVRNAQRKLEQQYADEAAAAAPPAAEELPPLPPE